MNITASGRKEHNGRLARWVACAIFIVFAPAPANASAPSDEHRVETPDGEFTAVRIAGPFEFPWSIAFLPDNSMLVTERPGRLQLIRPGSEPREIAGLPPVVSEKHAGLMDVAVDPDFVRNKNIYLSYSHGNTSSSVLRVVKAKLDLAGHELRNPKVIFESTPTTSIEQLGGRILVTDDGYLFITVGDRWKRENSQDLTRHDGTILRIRTDGSIPADNPFASQKGALPEIWSYGHRNPQGLALEASTGRLWTHEHGPKGGDELNLIVAGRNYGWPIVTYGRDYTGEAIGIGTAKEGLEQPLHYWVPSIAPSGLAVETIGDVTLFWIGTLAGQSVFRLEMRDNRVTHSARLLEGEFGRIRDVRIGLDGMIYFSTDDPQGAIYRLEASTEEVRKDGNPRGL